MQVISLNIKNEKTGRVERLEEAYLKKDWGIVGDVMGKNEKRQISIATGHIRTYLDGGRLRGICSLKFYENIGIEGLDVEKIKIGDKILIGRTIQEVTIIGKNCFPECELLKAKTPCPLAKGVLFTRVLEEGKITISDRVEIIPKWNR